MAIDGWRMFFLEVLQARCVMGWTYQCCFCERRKRVGEGEIEIFNFGFFLGTDELLGQRSVSPRSGRGREVKRG